MVTRVLNEKGGKNRNQSAAPVVWQLPILVRDTFWKNMSDAAAVMGE